MITAVPGVSIPVDGTVWRDLEGRVSFLVQILAVLGFDCSRINGVFGESEPSRCHDGYRGSYKPDCVQQLVLDVRVHNEPARGVDPRAGLLVSSLRQREHRERSAKRGVVAKGSIATDGAEARGVHVSLAGLQCTACRCT